jgi:hypothetical protein
MALQAVLFFVLSNNDDGSDHDASYSLYIQDDLVDTALAVAFVGNAASHDDMEECYSILRSSGLLDKCELKTLADGTTSYFTDAATLKLICKAVYFARAAKDKCADNERYFILEVPRVQNDHVECLEYARENGCPEY